MGLEDLVAIAPRSWRPALFILALVGIVGGVAIGGVNAVESKARAAVAPVSEKVRELEGGQKDINDKLGKILDQLTETNLALTVLHTEVKDLKEDNRHRP